MNLCFMSVLPAYHQKCIDPWLTKNKKTCPLCKKKVIPGEPDSSSEEDTDAEDGGENAPLIGNQAATGRSGGTFTSGG
jgi:E3 ubiquitin-protein ligase RNF13